MQHLDGFVLTPFDFSVETSLWVAGWSPVETVESEGCGEPGEDRASGRDDHALDGIRCVFPSLSGVLWGERSSDERGQAAGTVGSWLMCRSWNSFALSLSLFQTRESDEADEVDTMNESNYLTVTVQKPFLGEADLGERRPGRSLKADGRVVPTQLN